MQDGKRWIYYKGRRILVNTNGNILKNDYSLQKKKKEKEQVSVSRAKQRFKDNIYKYGIATSFEDSILHYNLQKNEIQSLYEYIKKMPEYERNQFTIDSMYQIYKDGINKED